MAEDAGGVADADETAVDDGCASSGAGTETTGGGRSGPDDELGAAVQAAQDSEVSTASTAARRMTGG